MNQLLPRILLFLGLTGMLISSCRQMPDPIRAIPPTDKELTIDRLEAAGIPPGNITIDQTKHEITVMLPASVNPSLPVSYTLGCSDCLIYCKTCAGPTGKTATDKDYLLLCFPPESQGWRVTTRDGKYQGPPYQVVFLADGDLRVDPSVTTVTHFPENNHFVLPVLSFHDGVPQGTVLIRSQATGAVVVTSSISCGRTDGPTEFIIPVPDDVLTLGDYTVEIIKPNGRRTDSPHPLVVRKGKVTVHGSWPDLSRDKETMRFYGYNLYAEDNLEVIIQHSGYSARLKPYKFTPDGRSFTVDTPPDLVPGYYEIIILQNGQRVVRSEGTIIVANQAQPFLYYITDGVTEKGPVSLKRGQQYPMDLSRNGNSDTKVTLKLVDIANPSRQYVVPVSHSTSYFWFTEGEYAIVVIPANVPAGRYQVTPRYQTGNILTEGLLYGWPVTVL